MYLITGAKGQLGTELRKTMEGLDCQFLDRSQCDITNSDDIKKIKTSNKIKTIINCAAYTNVDKAESETKEAFNINSHGVKNLVDASNSIGANLIHVSTDYVFDGQASRPYTEESPTNPASQYGKSKLEGEAYILKNAQQASIVRTSWLYNGTHPNFLNTMLRLASERDELNVVFDQMGTPTFALDLAQAITGLCKQDSINEREIYHFSNEGVASWFDFAYEIFKLSKTDCRLKPVDSSEFQQAAPRPTYTVMSKSKIKNKLGITIPHWKESLEQCLKVY